MKFPTKKIITKDIKGLQLHIFLIGYPIEGETALIFVMEKTDNKVLFSMMIDSYKYGEYNASHEILNQYNIKTLDYFVWTHPDNDHSVDIENTLKKFGVKATTVLLPEGVVNGRILGINATNALNYINQIGLNRKGYQVNRVSVTSQKSRTIFEETTYADHLAELEFSFSIIAPNSAIIGKRTTKNKKCKLNDFSIGLIIHFGDLNFIFAGDIENLTINQIPSFYFENNIGYIKIPHHSSSSSDALIKHIKTGSNIRKKQIIAATTTFSRFLLPKQEILNNYKSLCSFLFSTGTGENKYGYVKTVYNIAETTFEEPETSGNAYVI